MRLLEGIRVLDLTNVLAGPFCCYQLAALGADVIKVEVPGTGDLARELGADPLLNKKRMGTSFLAQNAGKRSITLNLKTATGKQVFQRLVATAQVVVENFRPGVMQRLGLDYEVLRQANPGLIYCAISGFGQDGPLKDNPAYDQIVQGLAGVMSVTGTKDGAASARRLPDCRHHRRPDSRIRHQRGIGSPRPHRRGGIHRRVDAGSHPGYHGLAGIQLSDRGHRAAACRQREHDRQPVGHLCHGRRASQYRSQSAGAV